MRFLFLVLPLFEACQITRRPKTLTLAVLRGSPSVSWYLRRGFLCTGFHVSRVDKDFLPDGLCFLEMEKQPPPSSGLKVQKQSPLFGEEVVGEAVKVVYPGDAFSYNLSITAFQKRKGYHKVFSHKDSTWKGSQFRDTLDLTAFFLNGHLNFERPLAKIALKCEEAQLISRAKRRRTN